LWVGGRLAAHEMDRTEVKPSQAIVDRLD